MFPLLYFLYGSTAIMVALVLIGTRADTSKHQIIRYASNLAVWPLVKREFQKDLKEGKELDVVTSKTYVSHSENALILVVSILAAVYYYQMQQVVEKTYYEICEEKILLLYEYFVKLGYGVYKIVETYSRNYVKW